VYAVQKHLGSRTFRSHRSSNMVCYNSLFFTRFPPLSFLCSLRIHIVLAKFLWSAVSWMNPTFSLSFSTPLLYSSIFSLNLRDTFFANLYCLSNKVFTSSSIISERDFAVCSLVDESDLFAPPSLSFSTPILSIYSSLSGYFLCEFALSF
jgi:hypothetical protein